MKHSPMKAITKRVQSRHPFLPDTIMGTIRAIKDRYREAFNSLPETLSNTVQSTQDVIIDLNRDQLLYGRDAKGDELRPTYLDDPYFKSFEAAKAYFIDKWRRNKYLLLNMTFTKVQLFPDKDANTPNLIHSTGRLFFNDFRINVGGNKYTVWSDGPAALDIERKYGAVYGLAPESRKYYYYGWLRPAIIRHYKK